MKRLHNLLDKYLNNSCSESEMKEFLNILKRADNEPEIKRSLSEVWKQISDSKISLKENVLQNSDQWFEEIYLEARAREKSCLDKDLPSRVPKEPRFLSYNHNFSQWIKVAAIMLFSVLLSLIYYTISSEEHVSSIVYTETIAKPGEKVRLMLSDGTQVNLNSGSRLEYPDSFDGSLTREVWLEGEAYFDVVHDNSRPFTIHAEEIVTKVLGTSFSIRSYPEEEEAMVAVAEGKVVVLESGSGTTSSGGNNSVELEANQWTNFRSNDQSFTTQIGNVSKLIAWNEGVLFYENEKLEEVAYQLERWYGVTINFENEEIKDCVIQGEHRKQTLENVLKTITYAFVGMEYQINGRQITLTGNGCK